MSGACPALNEQAFLVSVLDFIDCQARNLGGDAYQALASPGSSLSLALTGLLTLFVAFHGYRLLFGQTPDVREGVLAVVKIGVVIALATSWPAYRTLVYDVVLRGPAELVSEIGQPAGVPGAGGGLVARLGYADDALERLVELGPGAKDGGRAVLRARLVNGQSVMVSESENQSADALEPFALGGARLAFLTGAIGGLGAVRLLAGLLLGLGPFFIALLLFDGTRGLFEGWVRGLAATAIGAIAVTVLLGVELALIEPWLASLVARREANLPIDGAAIEVLVVTLAFAMVVVAGLGMAARVAIAFHLPVVWRQAATRWLAVAGGDGRSIATPATVPTTPARALDPPSRAFAVSDAVAATQRREALAAVAGGSGGSAPAAPGRTVSSQVLAREQAVALAAPLGHSFRRRTRGRVSASASRRDTGT